VYEVSTTGVCVMAITVIPLIAPSAVWSAVALAKMPAASPSAVEGALDGGTNIVRATSTDPGETVTVTSDKAAPTSMATTERIASTLVDP